MKELEDEFIDIPITRKVYDGLCEIGKAYPKKNIAQVNDMLVTESIALWKKAVERRKR